jgi:predicted ATP-dependent endonuclease of OLD family
MHQNKMTVIKLTSFNISNYRSIINTGWRSLASDNITVLIGQNESGKTSVLEALHSFYSNTINEDVLRSDNTFPEVSCSFQTEGDETVASLLVRSKLPNSLYEVLKAEKDFSLTRSWKVDKTSILYISSPKVSEYFSEIEKKEETILKETENEIEKLNNESDILIKQLANAESEKNNLINELNSQRRLIEEKERQLRKSKNPDTRRFAEDELLTANEAYARIETEQLEKSEIFERLKQQAQALSEKISIGKSYLQSKSNVFELSEVIRQKQKAIFELEHVFEICTNEKDRRTIYSNLQRTISEYEQSKKLLQQFEAELKQNLLIGSKVLLQGNQYSIAVNEALKELAEQNQFFSKFEIGEVLCQKIPVFEFFEDFSGLLPNKIDLEDILNNNQQVEGFKAAVNFLKIAGLDTAFFREKNHRILKQRIETLNSDLTINFQDYWSQQVGKDNKIRLHFELEHYDYTVPEKSGKPYLEFWIKDNQERLYPKQRSRGVRWFLSFYLELKAAAEKTESSRVLLIDEPGLSLHARAQEDVLKVFEDLKQSMQIIYCTHSPHLIKTEKLYRILAVQRADEEDDKSESVIYEPSMLSEVSTDTLTPLYSMMGIKLSDQQFIQSDHNVIVPDTIAYYYLHWLSKLLSGKTKINFIPAGNPGGIVQLINILSAWQVKFGVLLFGSESQKTLNEIFETSLISENTTGKIKVLQQFDFPEDILSTIDFKKYILQARTGITEKNSEYISKNGLSRKILAANFVSNLSENKIELTNFDETTKQNVNDVFVAINQLQLTLISQ